MSHYHSLTAYSRSHSNNCKALCEKLLITSPAMIKPCKPKGTGAGRFYGFYEKGWKYCTVCEVYLLIPDVCCPCCRHKVRHRSRRYRARI